MYQDKAGEYDDELMSEHSFANDPERIISGKEVIKVDHKVL